MNKTGLLLIVLLLMIQNAVSQVYLNYNQRCNQLTMDCTLQSHAEWSVGIGGDGILIEVTDKLGQKNVLYNSIGCSQYFIVTKEDSVIIDIFCFKPVAFRFFKHQVQRLPGEFIPLGRNRTNRQ